MRVDGHPAEPVPKVETWRSIGPGQRDIPTAPLNAAIETTTVVEARIAEACK